MLKENITKFLNYFQSLSYSKKSLKALKSRLGEFNDYVNGLNLSTISGIEYSHLLEFVSGEENTSAHVTKSRVWALKRFFRYLMLQNILSNNLAKDLSYPRLEKKVPQFLSAGEFERILHFLSERVAAPAFRGPGSFEYGIKDRKGNGLANLLLFLLMGVLGLRISTIRRLNTADVDLKSGRMWVREKGGVERFMILSPTLVYFLKCYLAIHSRTDKALFLSKRGKRISERALQRLVAEVGKACGFDERLHPHPFRHTAATHLCQVGMSISPWKY
jgi:integrase/recombinase XerC